MREPHREAEGRFYARCAEILGVPHTYRPWVGRPPNRWNNRRPGNGRFEGVGLIRMFSPTCIQVCLRDPAFSGLLRSPEAVYALLRDRIADR
jgi:hypothetical protein